MGKIKFNFGGEKLEFLTSFDVFSSASIDKGTQTLINSLRKNKDIRYQSVLDLGCGYGVISIYLKKTHESSNVYGIDRNAYAVELSRKNAKSNGADINYFCGLGYGEMDLKYDLIITNFPAKAGHRVLKKWILDSTKYLNDGGTFAMVVVKSLGLEVEKIIKEYNLNKVYEETKNGYNIYHFSNLKKIPYDDTDEYKRKEITFKNMKMKTANGLSEFDSLSFSTQLLISNIPKNISDKKILNVNPFQGHLPLELISLNNLSSIDIFSYDLLSLKFSSENILRNKKVNCLTYFDTKELNQDYDYIFWNACETRDEEKLKNDLNILVNNSKIIFIAGKTSVIKRVISESKRKPTLLDSKKGFSCFKV